MIKLMDEYRTKFPNYHYQLDAQNNKIITTCDIHGITINPYRPNKNVNMYPCKQCGILHRSNKLQYTDEEYIKHAKDVHKSKYAYLCQDGKIYAICNNHGAFLLDKNRKSNHINKLSGCPKCANEYKAKIGIGGYNMRQFKNHPELKTSRAQLYLIECYNDTEKFLKIGITTRRLEDRFKYNSNIQYNYNVIGIISGELLPLFVLEQQAKKQLKSVKYIPSLLFPGYTECFNMDALEELLKITNINNHE